jgi:hypothetical protein
MPKSYSRKKSRVWFADRLQRCRGWYRVNIDNGPVGIAIGVAIDEGIAKDIRSNADNGGIDFKSIFEQSVRQTDQFKQAESIEVKQYGFVIKNGSKDYVAAEIQILVTQDGEVEQRILSSWSKQQELERWVTLDELKTDSDVIKELFLMALK